jgi:hypothetical protein
MRHFDRGILFVWCISCSAPQSNSAVTDDGMTGGTGGTGAGANTGGTTGSVVPVDLSCAGAATACSARLASELFTTTIAESAWHNIDLTPADGMTGLQAALRALTTDEVATLPPTDPRRTKPVRIRLAAGVYEATGPGVGELFFGGIHRTSDKPLLIVAQNTNANATVLMQGLNFVAVDYLAIDGVTIGPATVGPFVAGVDPQPGAHTGKKPLEAGTGIHVSGYAENSGGTGQSGGVLDFAVYGKQHPSDHIIIQRVTIQNVFADDLEAGVLSGGGGADGIKFNQASNVWVLDSTINQTSRHGIDNVGVHNATFCNNVIANNGVGVGLEAKGGSTNVVMDSNIFINVRRVFLGGEKSDATYYWSDETPRSAEHYAYEARHVIARNNIVVNAREAAFAFAACHDCVLVNNTSYFDYALGAEDLAGDALREADTSINEDGASAECITGEGGDTIELCWNVSPYPAELMLQDDNPLTPDDNERRMRPLTNARNAMFNNLFINKQGFWSGQNPFNRNSADAQSLAAGQVDYNYWFNGGQAIGDGAGLNEGSHSRFLGSVVADPALTSTSIDTSTVGSDPKIQSDLAGARCTLRNALKPTAASPLVGAGLSSAPSAPSYDATMQARVGSTIGALQP